MQERTTEGKVLTQTQPVNADAAAARPLLEVDDLRVTLLSNGERLPIIRGVSFELNKGEILGLAGESGSGKSVTALALLHLLPANAEVGGRVVFDGQDITSLQGAALRRFRGTNARIIFQDPWSSLNPMLTIGRQLRSSLSAQSNVGKADANKKALEVLDLVHIAEARKRLDQYPHQLSGGMLQRVMIAYALIAEPQLVVCDEPTTALDVTTEAQILDLLTEINAELGTSFILTSHDLGVLADTCDRLMVMYAGELVEDGEVKDLLANPCHPYTTALVAASPGAAEPRTKLRALEGRPPHPSSGADACAFAPRCACAEEICHTAAPHLVPLSNSTSDRRAACWVTAPTAGTRR